MAKPLFIKITAKNFCQIESFDKDLHQTQLLYSVSDDYTEEGKQIRIYSILLVKDPPGEEEIQALLNLFSAHEEVLPCFLFSEQQEGEET